MGSSPVAATSISDFAPASSKEFLDIQATIECGFTLKRVRDMIRTYNQSSRGYFLEVKLEYPKELHKLHNDYRLAPDKQEIKKEMLSDYHLKIDDDYIIFIGNVKKLVCNFFDKKSMCFITKTCNFI